MTHLEKTLRELSEMRKLWLELKKLKVQSPPPPSRADDRNVPQERGRAGTSGPAH